jgi:hypothetical protein
LIEEIRFRQPHDKRWKNETINRCFVRTLPVNKWLPWIRATGDRIAAMTPAQLYTEIQLDDEVTNGKPADTSEANSLQARIGDKHGNGGNGGNG